MKYIFIYHNGNGEIDKEYSFVIKDLTQKELTQQSQEENFWKNLYVYMPYMILKEGIDIAINNHLNANEIIGEEIKNHIMEQEVMKIHEDMKNAS